MEALLLEYIDEKYIVFEILEMAGQMEHYEKYKEVCKQILIRNDFSTMNEYNDDKYTYYRDHARVDYYRDYDCFGLTDVVTMCKNYRMKCSIYSLFHREYGYCKTVIYWSNT